jgi:hypothetical protein
MNLSSGALRKLARGFRKIPGRGTAASVVPRLGRIEEAIHEEGLLDRVASPHPADPWRSDSRRNPLIYLGDEIGTLNDYLSDDLHARIAAIMSKGDWERHESEMTPIDRRPHLPEISDDNRITQR